MPRTSSHAIRQQRIIEVLQSGGAYSYAELQKLLGVSSMTTRRDVDVLAKRGVLIKTIGGAQYTKVPQFLLETSLSSRLGSNQAEKDAISARAMNFLEPQQTIFMDGSTTCITFARQIAKAQFPLSVVTNSGIIAMEIGVSAQAKVICVGGEYDSQSASFVGALAESTCATFFVDQAFMSTKAFEPEDGTYESSIATLRIKQLMAKQASKLILLVDSSKFGQRALCKVIDVKSIDTIITDRKCPKEALQKLQNLGRQVFVAEPKASHSI